MALVCAGTMGVEEERQSEVTATLLNVRSRAQTQWAKYKVLEELQMQRDGVPGVHVGGGTGFWARCLGAGHDAVWPSVGIGMNPYGDALGQRARALGEVLEALGMVSGCYERCFWCWAWMQVRPQCGLA